MLQMSVDQQVQAPLQFIRLTNGPSARSCWTAAYDHS